LTTRSLLLAHHDSAYLDELVQRFSDAGYEIVGTARTARMALALAALGPVDAAVVGHRLGGERDGPALARTLESLWGIPSRLIEQPDPDGLALGLTG
jgi:hypothetical protein